jgi:nicotinic acid mononucleotide adenylyltransferase
MSTSPPDVQQEYQPEAITPVSTKRQTKTCFFFGTFNPIHQAHLMMAQCVLEYGQFDRILFIPSGLPPHRMNETTLASATDRLKMTRLMRTRLRMIATATMHPSSARWRDHRRSRSSR